MAQRNGNRENKQAVSLEVAETEGAVGISLEEQIDESRTGGPSKPLSELEKLILSLLDKEGKAQFLNEIRQRDKEERQREREFHLKMAKIKANAWRNEATSDRIARQVMGPKYDREVVKKGKLDDEENSNNMDAVIKIRKEHNSKVSNDKDESLSDRENCNEKENSHEMLNNKDKGKRLYCELAEQQKRTIDGHSGEVSDSDISENEYDIPIERSNNREDGCVTKRRKSDNIFRRTLGSTRKLWGCRNYKTKDTKEYHRDNYPSLIEKQRPNEIGQAEQSNKLMSRILGVIDQKNKEANEKWKPPVKETEEKGVPVRKMNGILDGGLPIRNKLIDGRKLVNEGKLVNNNLGNDKLLGCHNNTEGGIVKQSEEPLKIESTAEVHDDVGETISKGITGIGDIGRDSWEVNHRSEERKGEFCNMRPTEKSGNNESALAEINKHAVIEREKTRRKVIGIETGNQVTKMQCGSDASSMKGLGEKMPKDNRPVGVRRIQLASSDIRKTRAGTRSSENQVSDGKNKLMGDAASIDTTEGDNRIGSGQKLTTKGTACKEIDKWGSELRRSNKGKQKGNKRKMIRVENGSKFVKMRGDLDVSSREDHGEKMLRDNDPPGLEEIRVRSSGARGTRTRPRCRNSLFGDKVKDEGESVEKGSQGGKRAKMPFESPRLPEIKRENQITHIEQKLVTSKGKGEKIDVKSVGDIMENEVKNGDSLREGKVEGGSVRKEDIGSYTPVIGRLATGSAGEKVERAINKVRPKECGREGLRRDQARKFKDEDEPDEGDHNFRLKIGEALKT